MFTCPIKQKFDLQHSPLGIFSTQTPKYFRFPSKKNSNNRNIYWHKQTKQVQIFHFFEEDTGPIKGQSVGGKLHELRDYAFLLMSECHKVSSKLLAKVDVSLMSLMSTRVCI